VRFKDGEVLDRNFDSYQIPRFSWLPKIETIIIDNPGLPAQGCGEPPIITMGAVIANAIYDDRREALPASDDSGSPQVRACGLTSLSGRCGLPGRASERRHDGLREAGRRCVRRRRTPSTGRSYPTAATW
jgi:hypothetical protein